MTKSGKAGLAAGLVAMVATTPLPAMAAYGTKQAATAQHEASNYNDASDYHRRRWRNRRLDVDAGDVIAGIGLIALIAAIADSAGKDKRHRNERNYDEESPRDYDRAPDSSYRGSDDVGSAVTACTDAAERSAKAQVDEIRSVTREGAGWRVEGDIGNNGFTCEVNAGRVESIRINDREI
jgi:hypothetical protein